MKIYKKIIFDKNNNIIFEDFYNYNGPIIMTMGIHFDYKSLAGVRAMEKKKKREKKLASRKAKRAEREAKEGPKKDIEVEKKLDESIPIDLNFLTNPDKK